MDQIDIVQLLLRFGILQGLFLALLLLLSRRHRKQSNILLAFFLLAYSFKLLLNTNIKIGIGGGYYLVSILLLGPLYFLYVKSVTKPDFKLHLSHLWHLVPAVIYLLLIGLVHYFFEGMTYRMIFEDTQLLYTTSLLQAVVALQTVVYALMVVGELRSYQHRLTEKYAYFSHIDLLWLRHLSVAFALILGIWLFFGYGDIAYFIKVFGEPPLFIAYVFWALMSLVVLVIGYYGLLRPELFLEDIRSVRTQKVSNKLDFKELNELKSRLLRLMKEKKPYLNPTLRLHQLAKLTEVNTGILSQVINEGLGKNFNDFVNEYRVREFTKRLNSGKYDDLTLLAIAFDSGFNSKSTFNAVFKKFTGYTPNQFKKQQIRLPFSSKN